MKHFVKFLIVPFAFTLAVLSIVPSEVLPGIGPVQAGQPIGCLGDPMDNADETVADAPAYIHPEIDGPAPPNCSDLVSCDFAEYQESMLSYGSAAWGVVAVATFWAPPLAIVAGIAGLVTWSAAEGWKDAPCVDTNAFYYSNRNG